MGVRVWAAIVCVPVLFGLAGCGDDGGGSGVASAGGAGAEVSASRSLAPEDAQLKFAQCMRDNGVDVPDPGPNGEVRLPEGDIDRNAMEKAREKCGDKLPGGGK